MKTLDTPDCPPQVVRPDPEGPRIAPARPVVRAAAGSLAGMAMGWLVMNSLVSGGLLIAALFDSGAWDGGVFLVLMIFGLASAIVCLVAWLVVAWPVTTACWSELGERDGAWWRHGVRGAGGGLATGILPLLAGAPPSAAAVFAGLAAVAGGSCGAWIGWRVRGRRLRREAWAGDGKGGVR